MAGTMRETPLVSASVEALLQKLVSADFPSTKVHVPLLINLKKTLTKIQPVLDHYAVNTKWLDLLIDVVHEVDRLFDQISIELEPHYQTLTPTTKVHNIFHSRFKQIHDVINSKIQKLTGRLECLILGELGFSDYSNVSYGTPSSSILDDESSIYGRGMDKEKLKHLLLSNDGGGNGKMGIISIVGMGGIGKTTLAKLLYNDPQVKENFELKVWAYISKDFDAVRIFETILESIASQSIGNDNLSSLILESHNAKGDDTIYQNLLLLSLQQILNTSKFLLVLDDVWDTKSVDWIRLMDTFNAGEMGSKIIITTRDERVARSMQTIPSVYYLRPLESEDCWSLFARYAFGTYHGQQRSYLEKIGRKIAKKCDGLPLAAIEFGAILYGKLSLDDWDCVLESNIWESTNPKVHAALESSYHFLLPPIKRCFAYCSIFPKKYILEKKMVVQLWIAEDLVDSFAGQESWKVGEEYFDVLVSKSLIQRRSTEDKEANFEMHNLVHDLATMVSSPYCIRLGEHYVHEKVRNLSYNRGLYDSFDKFDKFDKLYGLKYLRTFLALPLLKQSLCCFLSNKVVHDLLPTMKQLRVLSLSNYKSITEVPKSIGDLLYLQYLNLSHTNIERLPSETCNLHNLQFLLLAGCKRLSELPKDMGKLVNLHHLDVSDTALRQFPVQIAKLENLQTLSDFVVSKHNDGLKVAELGKFSHLYGKLSISQLQNVNNLFEVDQANIKMKEEIDELSLEWDCDSIVPNSQIKSVVLEHLRPSTNLKSLTIKGCGGISFPNWLGDFSFRNMVYLKISNCDDCLWLPPLGQLENLKELSIEGMSSVQTIGIEFYGSDDSSFQPFPSLEILHFKDMQEWDKWNITGEDASQESLSVLRSLKIWDCNELESFPPGGLATPNLNYFAVWKCEKLPSLPEAMHTLAVLQEMEIDNLPNLQSFAIYVLPYALRELTVGFVGGIMRHIKHSWEYLPYLSVLRINGDGTIKMLLGRPLLSAKLVTLCICGLDDTSIDDKWLQHLTSLQNFEIVNAPKLKFLPKKGLPSSLSLLSMTRCPLLVAKLRRKRGQEWRKIAHIPAIIIDDELIT
ncbi:putative disease resistance RPP13-like protein 1 isoform X2 [Vicia villosa]|uniref:putative disease resistance RPP13-like protein 1 isoform X2 n=1 Tax=Vicia villosa TaxID=3911 RepID=UPI00273CAC45|nr:putative disease resistance RPP13-like protein 1 isoform X2 [Vicia villosa]